MPLGIGLLSQALPGRAQTTTDARFAFADTTLLRDTLGIRFDRLFLIADSLRITPDTLRALSVRYGFSPEQLVAFADSMRVPVDSVGVVLLRERYNPLAHRAGETVNKLTYNTTYNVQQTRTGWNNGVDYHLVVGSLFLHNATTVQIDRFKTTTRTTIREAKNSTTEAGWKLNEEQSVGARLLVDRFDSNDQNTFNDTRDEYQLSVRTRQRPNSSVASELNVFTGVLDYETNTQVKRGLTADVNGNLDYSPGAWLGGQLIGQLTRNYARSRPPSSDDFENTQDHSENIRGSINLWQANRLSLISSAAFQNSRVENPGDLSLQRVVRTQNTSADATLRFQLTADRFFNLTPAYTASEQASQVRDRQTERSTRSLNMNGRYNLQGFVLEGRFNNDFTDSEIPGDSSGTGEDLVAHSIDMTLTRRFSTRVDMRLNAGIGITRYRYANTYIAGTPSPLPPDRDNVRQSYRIEGNYTFSEKFNTGLSLDVSRTQLVNLPSASASANNVGKIYRTEWRWSYRLLRGLTVTQRNSMSANYIFNDFLPTNDRLILDYGTVTTLSTLLTRRLNFDITHNAQVTPSGNYLRQPDGLSYFNPADESNNRSLASTVTYTPTQGVSFNMNANYRFTDRNGTLNGIETPVRESRSLQINGGANLNLPIMRRGRLTGTFGRSVRSEQNTTFPGGVAQTTPTSEQNFWNGSMQFSWQL